MLQVRSIDDVGRAYDNLATYDVPEVMSLGRHSNDQMTSFYCTTPSGFNIEYGFDGLELTPEWVPRTYTSTSIWGHKRNPDSSPGIVHTIES